MRHIFVLWMVAASAGCVASQPAAQQRMLLLPNGQVLVNGETSDLSSALKRLGTPQTTQINIVGCRNTTFATIAKASDILQKVGYTRIGFAEAEEGELALCADEP